MNKIIIILLILSGIFFYPMSFMIGKSMLVSDRFYPSQFGFFIFSFGILGSLLLYKKNKWIGYLCALCSLMFLKTYLFQQAPIESIYKDVLIGAGIFGVYYAARELITNERYLLFFCIPAALNSILIIIQKYDHNLLPFMPIKGVQGFLGNSSVSGCFIALTIPIFLKYYKRLLPLVIVGILLSGSWTAVLIMIVSSLIYFKDEWNKLWVIFIILFCIVFSAQVYFKEKVRLKEDIKQRSAMYLGALDGIKHNPILGWGVGSFEPIMRQVKPEDSHYGWGNFNKEDAIMNHPHNEVLYGWWCLGILFPILFFGLIWSLIKSFKKEKILEFAILTGGFICMMFYFLSLPALFLIIIVLALYHKEEVKNVCNTA